MYANVHGILEIGFRNYFAKKFMEIFMTLFMESIDPEETKIHFQDQTSHKAEKIDLTNFRVL